MTEPIPVKPSAEGSVELSPVTRRQFLQVAGVAGAVVAGARYAGAAAVEGPLARTLALATARPRGSQFLVTLDGGAITHLERSGDSVPTDYVAAGRRLGDVIVTYRRPGGQWRTTDSATMSPSRSVTESADPTGSSATYRIGEPGSTLLSLTIAFAVRDDAIDWTIALQSEAGEPVEIGDLAIPLPITARVRSGPRSNITILKHSFISGHGSYLFWQRSNCVGPYLILTTAGDTPLEYWDVGPASDGRAGDYRVYAHSTAAGAAAATHGGRWRQPHTSLTLASKGSVGDARRYGLTFRWAGDRDAVRDLLVASGLIDVHVAPGMTIPSDLTARFALRSTRQIDAVEAEFPTDTTLTSLGSRGDLHLYEARFARLGENLLTIRYAGGRHLYLEFFSTEPLETLVKKRAAFLAGCQHRDPAKWYDGLISEWNMESQVLLGPDNYDRITGWRIYEVSCDDPGLGKPAYLAAKNAEFPVQREVEALDYYIAHFVWGGLQRTTDEEYSYGLYGIPDWKQNRESADPGKKGRLHIWRPYDYPHVTLLYYSMYRVAKEHQSIRTVLRASDYLQRAYGTALAMFVIPFEIDQWSAYGTGFYNELVIVDLIRALEEEGLVAQADTLRWHWEKKVRTFINDKPDLFASEYAFDSTGFESTHALAKYAVQHASAPEGARSSGVAPQAAARFMEAQMAANLFCRGTLEPAYYYLGSDYRGGGGNRYVLTYMSQMGGWAVLDYALHHATDPAPYLRLGYASYLSAWALVNSGTPESDYGYWYPGQGNDGGAGGGFEPAAYGQTWLGQPHHRGSWYYGCEIDLGYCGALRSATTILADDPIFGRMAFGGELRTTATALQVVPRDGLRKRFHAAIGERRLRMELASDRFAAGQPIELSPALSSVRFHLESDDPTSHEALIRLSLADGDWAVLRDGAPSRVVHLRPGSEVSIGLPMATADTPGGRSFTLALMAM
jgi:hypothetical protein